MWDLAVVMLLLCLGATDSSRVITSARDRYQRPHGLDQLRYMLESQTDRQQATAQSNNGRPDLTSPANERPDLTSPANGRPDLTSPANGRPDHTSRTATRQPLVRNTSQETPAENRVADIRDFPYVASVQLLFNGTWYFVCGGSLVSTDKVLTAAHCILGVPRRSLFRVILGSNFYHQRADDQIINVIQGFLHPGFDITRLGGRRGLYAHDLAVLKLARAVSVSETVWPIPLADARTNIVGRRCVLAGYGISNPNNPAPSRLQSAQLTVVSSQQCQQMVDSSSLVKEKVFIRDLHLCTADAGSVPCMGDSGSALVCDGKVFGVYSFGDTSCAAGGHLPRGFMSVQYYLPFLRLVLRL